MNFRSTHNDFSSCLCVQQIGPTGEIETKISVMNLPSPDGQEGILTAAVNSQGSSSLATLPEHANAMALQFNEDVSMGALAKAGALPMGENDWIKFAENKMKKDNALDHQSLLWEMGSDVCIDHNRFDC